MEKMAGKKCSLLWVCSLYNLATFLKNKCLVLITSKGIIKCCFPLLFQLSVPWLWGQQLRVSIGNIKKALSLYQAQEEKLTPHNTSIRMSKNRGVLLPTFYHILRVYFWTLFWSLLHTLTISQMITDIHCSSQIFQVSVLVYHFNGLFSWKKVLLTFWEGFWGA